ncbi:hypothetical protein ABT298_33355, partial [Streptomyces sp. NPDC001034]
SSPEPRHRDRHPQPPRFVRLGGRRADAMVLVRNERARHAWSAAGYGPQEQWRRWVKPLTDRVG